MTGNKRLRIGLFIGLASDRYHSMLLPGVVETAKKKNADLMLLVSGSLEPISNGELQANILYDIIGADNIDGLIIPASIGNFVPKEKMRELCRRFHPVPIVFICDSGVQDYPAVLVNNYSGMYQLVRHFVKDHGYRKIAFICGPENNNEAINRFNAYKDVLKEFDIPFDPNLVAPGNFWGPSGRIATQILVEERKVKFEALIAANDDMLLNAFGYLQEKGFKIPGDIALGGFDDAPEATITRPPLTTVAQPIYEQSRKATEMIIDIINGKTVESVVEMPTILVIRQSCGCQFKTKMKLINQSIENGNKKEFDNSPQKLTELAVRNIKEMNINLEKKQQLEETLNSIMPEYYTDLMSSGLPIHMTEAISSLIANENLHSQDLEYWTSIFSNLQIKLMESVSSGDMKSFIYSDYILQIGRNIIGESLARNYNRDRRELWETLWKLRMVTQVLSITFEIEKLTAILEKELGNFDIENCFLSIYESNVLSREDFTNNFPEYSRMIFALQDKIRINFDNSNNVFKTRQLVPGELLSPEEQMTFIVFPVFFEKEHYGIIIFEMCELHLAIIMETLKDHICSAFKGINIFNELKNTQNQLAYTAKMASLGELTAGIAHELKNPLNFVNNFSETIVEYAGEMKELLSDPSRSPGELSNSLKKILDSVILSANIIHKHGKRANSIIVGMLNQARGDVGYIESYQLNNLLSESSNLAFHSSRSQYPTFNIMITNRFSDNLPELKGNLAQLNSAFLNIITNAYYSMRQKKNQNPAYQPELEIRTYQEKHHVVAEITDNGVGIPAHIKDKIFQPFFTTKPSHEGTGLGLKMVYDIIVDGHDGEIQVDSKEGEYAKFIVRLKIAK